jgi:hypothetical protein
MKHHHFRHRHGAHRKPGARRLDWELRRARRRGEDELATLERHQRDVEEHLADVTERIRRVRAGSTSASEQE